MGVSKEKKSLYSKFNGNDDDYHLMIISTFLEEILKIYNIMFFFTE